MAPNDFVGKLIAAYKTDPFFKHTSDTSNLRYLEDLWWRSDQIVVPRDDSVRRLIFWHYHDAPYAGHLSVKRTFKAVQQHFYWTNMHRDCADYIANCPDCQVYENFPGKPAGEMLPITVPPHRWHTVTTDYVTGLPESDDGHDAIAVFIDKLTKYVYIMPCTVHSHGKDWADMFMASVHTNQGLPDRILSDRGSQFRGVFNQALAKRLGITWDLTSPYRPSSNNMTERTNRTIEGMMRTFVSPTMTDWDKHLNLIQFAINNAWQETVQNTPFLLNHGRHAKTALTAGITQLDDKLTENPAAAEYAQKMQQLTARARNCMLFAQQRQKRYYDQHHVKVNYEVLALMCYCLLNI